MSKYEYENRTRIKKIAHLPSCFENFTPYVTNTFSGVTQLSHSVFNGGGGNLLKVTYNWKLIFIVSIIFTQHINISIKILVSLM